jgi:hypothetical protein
MPSTVFVGKGTVAAFSSVTGLSFATRLFVRSLQQPYQPQVVQGSDSQLRYEFGEIRDDWYRSEREIALLDKSGNPFYL